jgi:lambda family phage portal protein
MARRSIARDKSLAALRARRRARKRSAPAARLVGRYDAAQSSDSNAEWWSAADALSAKAANSPGVRAKLRKRARYEVANNSYACGMERTLANHTIGSGPRFQMTGDVSRDAADEVERKFREWCDEVDLTGLLSTMRKARMHDGESFLRLDDNPSLECPVTIFPRLYEAEQVSSPMPWMVDENQAVDGIVFDGHGLPSVYHLLRTHPGGSGLNYGLQKIDIPAGLMIHDYVSERPGQARGIPEITPAIPLYALLRDYTLATLDAAKAAAYFAAILHTTGSPSDPTTGDVGSAAAVDALDTIHLARNMLTTMPEGWDMRQMQAEHPNATFPEFHAIILQEAARCLNIPYNIAAGNSSTLNYASGRLDHQNYYHSIRTDQKRIARQQLDRIFRLWRNEAVLIEGYLSQELRSTNTDWTHSWTFDGMGHVDPVKEAKGQEIRLRTGVTSIQVEAARDGHDWEELQDQQIEAQIRYAERRRQIAQERGIDIDQLDRRTPPHTGNDDEDDEDDEDDPAVNKFPGTRTREKGRR